MLMMAVSQSFRTVGFVIAFSTFLLGCIDYSKFRHGEPAQLSDVIIDRCISRSVNYYSLFHDLIFIHRFSGFTFLFFLLFTAFYLWQIITYVLGVLRLVDMYNFYTHLLRIPDVS